MHRPMLACDVDLTKVTYPLWGSPKLDGIRGTNQIGKLWSRKLILLPNLKMQREFGHPLLDQFDGELIYGDPAGPDVLSKTYSAVMTKESDLSVDYYVFDLLDQGSMSFEDRFEILKRRVELACKHFQPGRIVLVEQRILEDEAEVLAYEIECVEKGYEGLMLRDASKPYKYNRSSMVGRHLMKLKRFEDSEAVIIGFEEQMRNDNVKVVDAQGLAKRSSHKANKKPTGMLGKFVVRDLKTGVVFSLSGRISKKQRLLWWKHREELLGEIVTYKHFAVTGVKDKPRLPIFKWFRHPMDFD